MHCTKCGAELTGNTRFCTKCGAPAVTTSAAGATVVKSDKRSLLRSTKAKIIIAAIAVVVLLAIVLAAAFAGRRSWKKTVDIVEDFVSGRGNAESMLSIIPEEYTTEITRRGGMTRAEMEDYLREEMAAIHEDLASYYGPNYRVVFNISDKYKYSEAELRTLNEELYDSCYFSKKNTASAAMSVTIRMVCVGNGERDEDEENIILIKIGRKWYMSPTRGGF